MPPPCCAFCCSCTANTLPMFPPGWSTIDCICAESVVFVPSDVLMYHVYEASAIPLTVNVQVSPECVIVCGLVPGCTSAKYSEHDVVLAPTTVPLNATLPSTSLVLSAGANEVAAWGTVLSTMTDA